MPLLDRLTLPGVPVDVPEVATAIEEYRRLEAEHSAEGEKLFELEERRPDAVRADEEAYGAAIRARKGDPGPVNVQAADAAIAESRRRAGALAVAVSTAAADVEAAVAKARSSWEKKLSKQVADARADFPAAVETLATAHKALADRLSLALWLKRFPGAAPWKPPAELAQVAGLKAPSGDGHRPEVVLAALRAHGQAKPEPTPKAPVQPLRPPLGLGNRVSVPA